MRIFTEEHKRKQSKASKSQMGNKNRLGKFHTEETKKKMSLALKGHNSGDKNGKYKPIEEIKTICALHRKIEKIKPKPNLCENCGKKKAYDLANISGEYKRIVEDWEWLCRKCHMTKDGRLKNLKQYHIKGLKNAL